MGLGTTRPTRRLLLALLVLAVVTAIAVGVSRWERDSQDDPLGAVTPHAPPPVLGGGSPGRPRGPSMPAPGHASVEVEVRDVFGRPVPGALVRWRRTDATPWQEPGISTEPTGVAGPLTLELPAPIDMEVVVQATGFMDHSTRTRIVATDPRVRLQVVLARDMAASGRLVFGRVVTSEGRIVGGANLELRTSLRTVTRQADPETGLFEFELALGEDPARLVATAPPTWSGLRSERLDAPMTGRFQRIILQSEDVPAIDLELDAGQAFGVLGPGSDEVRFSLLGPDSLFRRGATQRDPLVRFAAMPAGRYRLAAHRITGGLLMVDEFEVRAPAPFQYVLHGSVPLVRVSGRLAAQLRGGARQVRFLPAELARGALRGDFDELLPAVLASGRFFYLDGAVESALVGEDGRFSLTLPVGRYSTQPIDALGRPVAAAIELAAPMLGETEPESMFAEAPVARLRLTPSRTPPEPGAEMFLYAPTGLLFPPVGQDQEGSYSFEAVPSGQYRALLVHRSGSTLTSAGPEVRVYVPSRGGEVRLTYTLR